MILSDISERNRAAANPRGFHVDELERTANATGRILTATPAVSSAALFPVRACASGSALLLNHVDQDFWSANLTKLR